MTGRRESWERISERISIPLRPGRVRSSSTKSNGWSAICERPSSPVTAVSTSNPSISSRVCKDSRISASSSMMSTEPVGEGSPFIVPRAMTAASDMNCLPAQGKVQGKGRPGPRITFYAYFAGMLLDDAVGDRKSQAGATLLTLFGGRLGREEGIVYALDMFGCDARSGVGHSYADHVAIGGGHVQRAASRHGVLGVEEQVEEDLLQSSGISLDGGNSCGQLRVHLNLGNFELVLEKCERVGDDLVNVDIGEFGSLVREKFSRLLTISEARKVCRVIFSSNPDFWGSPCSCLASIWVYDEITARGVVKN